MSSSKNKIPTTKQKNVIDIFISIILLIVLQIPVWIIKLTRTTKYNWAQKIIEKYDLILRELNFKGNIYPYIKRILDLIMSLILLIILFIPMIIISILIKLDSKGPVIFKQKRTGKDGKEFDVFKFRTMAQDNNVHDFSKADQHTKIGKILRKTSLDELPQLLNVIKGDMSFIGPRPWIPDYYKNMTKKQRHRCDVLPGITGLAQAKGRNNISIIDKINYDLEYVEKYSLKEDLYVVLKTIKTVLSKEGADAGKNTIQTELDILKTQEIKLKDIKKAYQK